MAWKQLLSSSSKWNEADPPLTPNGLRIARDASLRVRALIAGLPDTQYTEVLYTIFYISICIIKKFNCINLVNIYINKYHYIILI